MRFLWYSLTNATFYSLESFCEVTKVLVQQLFMSEKEKNPEQKHVQICKEILSSLMIFCSGFVSCLYSTFEKYIR